MAKDNTQFLRFSAYSMKELITRKLSEDSKFTDQIYEGSNLAILIDIVSYIYQCLAYQLNNAAAESMFADTQLYDNMIRLVQFIGYNPRGCEPASFTGIVYSTATDEEWYRLKAIPKFTYFVTQKTGRNGNPICFSTSYDDISLESDTKKNVQFYNGRWKAYSLVYTASGLENESFILDGLKSDSDNGRYVSANHIKVIIESKYNEDGTASDGYSYDDGWYNDRDGIFLRSRRRADSAEKENVSTNLYREHDKIYTLSLDENKTYHLKFGDGITGKKLHAGDRIYVFYLDSDGPDGEIDLSEIDFATVKLRHDIAEYRSYIPDGLYESIFSNVSAFFDPTADGPHKGEIFAETVEVRAGSTVTTQFEPEENVQDIRESAPGWFKTGNRLITAKDTEYYVKECCNSLDLAGVVDVKCMNNMQYVATFYKWLYENGIKSKDRPERAAEQETGVDPGKYYLDNVTFDRVNFRYVDPADANNTYLWIKTNSEMQDHQIVSEENQKAINEKLYHLKTITTEYYLVKPVLVKFAICANPDLDDVRERYFKETDANFDQGVESYVEITLDDNVIYVSSNIQKMVYNEILKAFDVNSQKLGGMVKFQDIVNNIYAINGVQRVRTVYQRNGKIQHAYDGVSFASWSEESVLRFHEDLQVGNVMRHVEDFQFPVLENEIGLFDRIKVITKAMYQVQTIKF